MASVLGKSSQSMRCSGSIAPSTATKRSSATRDTARKKALSYASFLYSEFITAPSA